MRCIGVSDTAGCKGNHPYFSDLAKKKHESYHVLISHWYLYDLCPEPISGYPQSETVKVVAKSQFVEWEKEYAVPLHSMP